MFGFLLVFLKQRPKTCVLYLPNYDRGYKVKMTTVTSVANSRIYLSIADEKIARCVSGVDCVSPHPMLGWSHWGLKTVFRIENPLHHLH